VGDWLDLLAGTYEVVRAPVTYLDETLLGRPTPCPEWTVRDLAEHTIGAMEMSAAAASGAPTVGRGVEGTLVERFDAAVADNLAAWKSLPDWSSALTLPFGEFPADLVAGMNQLDSLVHGWDLGSALRVQVALPERLADAARRTAEVRVPLGRGRVFGAEVTTASTDPGERLLAFTGRDPDAWPGAIWVVGSLVTIKPTGIDPAPASAVEIWEREGSGPARHVHADHDEMWYVLEGRFGFALGDRQFHAGPGQVIVGPRGVPHAFRAETARSRLLDIHLPGGFERYFVRVGTPATALTPRYLFPGPREGLQATCFGMTYRPCHP